MLPFVVAHTFPTPWMQAELAILQRGVRALIGDEPFSALCALLFQDAGRCAGFRSFRHGALVKLLKSGSGFSRNTDAVSTFAERAVKRNTGGVGADCGGDSIRTADTVKSVLGRSHKPLERSTEG